MGRKRKIVEAPIKDEVSVPTITEIVQQPMRQIIDLNGMLDDCVEDGNPLFLYFPQDKTQEEPPKS
jgi:hypothetical protein